jgi:DNA mismatch repair ATPase MutS
MAAGDGFLRDVAARVLLTPLTDPAEITYRQRILTDCLAEPAVIREMYDTAVGALEDKRRQWGFFSSQSPGSTLSSAVRQLEVLIVRLRDLRQIADRHAGKFRSEGLTTLCGTLQRELDDEYFEELRRHLRQLRFREGELISMELDRDDNSSINYVLRLPWRRGWKQRVRVGPRTVYSFTIPPRDESGGQALQDMTNRGINLVANAAAQSADHVSSYFAMLRAELGFYVGCLNLHDRLTARQVPVVAPVPSAEPLRFACEDLRDASLALRIDTVVGNDVSADGKGLLIITGANSGGKSTFLRSAGLAQLMMQAGMFVAARGFVASVSAGVCTHFVREEDPDLVSGRLDEELRRMSEIADRVRAGSLVLFNESFAATNEREGSEIGRQVVQALLEAGVRVFFVTHQFDLADGLRRARTDGTLFLRAERHLGGERDFHLTVADPLPTSYGEDLYYRIGGWLGADDPAGRPGPAPD